MAEAVMLVVTLLAIGFIATRLSEWLKLPHSVFLVVLGLVAGWGIRSLNPQLIEPLTAEFPEIILYVLLPPLIFESAYNIDLKALQRDLVPVSALAVVGLILSTILVGFGMHWGCRSQSSLPCYLVHLFRQPTPSLWLHFLRRLVLPSA